MAITENYCRTSTTAAAAALRFHALPHSPSTYTTFPKAVTTTVRSGCNVAKKTSKLLHVREQLANKGEPTSLWAWKDTPRAAWQGTTGGTTFVKAATREVVDQMSPVYTGAFYADDPYPSEVVQAQGKVVNAVDELADAYEDIKKLLSDPPSKRGGSSRP